MKSIFFVLFLLLPLAGMAQIAYLLPNEQVVFSFETGRGKRMVLAKDKANAYIIYRFGSREKIEMEFPSKTQSSWKQFTYSFYLRGGGPGNAGMDLNYVYFEHDHVRYVIYDTYFAETGRYAVGIRVMTPGRKTIDIRGKTATRRGTMTGFRDNELLTIGDELFD